MTKLYVRWQVNTIWDFLLSSYLKQNPLCYLITVENINLIKAVKFMLDKVGRNKRKGKKVVGQNDWNVFGRTTINY